MKTRGTLSTIAGLQFFRPSLLLWARCIHFALHTNIYATFSCFEKPFYLSSQLLYENIYIHDERQWSANVTTRLCLSSDNIPRTYPDCNKTCEWPVLTPWIPFLTTNFHLQNMMTIIEKPCFSWFSSLTRVASWAWCIHFALGTNS